MNSTPNRPGLPSAAELLARLTALAALPGGLPDPSTPLGRMTHEFFSHNWAEARDGLLRRTRRVRVTPHGLPAPHVFDFAYDLPYKRWSSDGGPLELAPGPITGTIRYRCDVFQATPEEQTVVVFVDRHLELASPHYSRRHGILCGGALPPGPPPLDFLLEHYYAILAYENVNLLDPFDPEAFERFRDDPSAWEGLEDPRPLWGPGSGEEEDPARSRGVEVAS